jgi:hypothetical protein
MKEDGYYMSDRIYAYTVILDGEYKDEDVEQVQHAIEMIKGVRSVTPQVSNPEIYFAKQKIRDEIGEKIINIIYPKEEL